MPNNVVYFTIDVLLGCLAQWRAEAYSQPDEEAWAALMAAASQALAGLVAAYGTDRAAESVRRRKEQMESWRRSEEAHTGACETASGPLTDHVDGEAR